MAILEVAKIQVRRGEEIQTGVPQLDPGEFGWAEDTENLYIGKRISEGAVNDENTRILTENDLNFFKLAILNTGTVASSYLYRQDISTSIDPVNGYLNYTTSTTVQSKLDQYVSLCDFGVLPSSTPADITVELENAIQDLFFNNSWDDWRRADTRRALLIPAGNYLVSENIKLPPYARLVGQGAELTKLTLISTSTGMFKTVDALGRTFEDGDMESGIKRSRNVHIQGMTLAFDSSNSSNDNPLLSLDNTLDAIVEDVLFKTDFDSTSTTTYGITNVGIGITIRGVGSGIGSGDSNLCENIRIYNCKFDGLNKGISGRGPIIRPIINNSVFSNLQLGIELVGEDVLPGPMNGHVFQNRFENIVRNGLKVNSGITNVRGNNISENNFFVQVGNGIYLDDNVTSEEYPVIDFGSGGNYSVNDFFQRKVVADSAEEVGGGFYYNPLVIGTCTINDNNVYSSSIAPSNLESIAKLPCTDSDQIIDIRYQMVGNNLSRKGHLTINVADSGGIPAFAALSDSYNFIETLETKISSFSNVVSPIYFANISNIIAPSYSEPIKVITSTPHGLPSDSPVVMYNMAGMYELTGNTYYISVDGTQTNNLFLWYDEDLSLPVIGVDFSPYYGSGEVYYSLLPNQFSVNLDSYPEFEELIGSSPYPNHPVSVPPGWYVTSDNINFAVITEYVISTSAGGQMLAIFTTQALSNSIISFEAPSTWSLVKSKNDGLVNGDSNIKFEVSTDFADSSSQNYMVLKCNNESLEQLSISYQITTQL